MSSRHRHLCNDNRCDPGTTSSVASTADWKRYWEANAMESVSRAEQTIVREDKWRRREVASHSLASLYCFTVRTVLAGRNRYTTISPRNTPGPKERELQVITTLLVSHHRSGKLAPHTLRTFVSLTLGTTPDMRASGHNALERVIGAHCCSCHAGTSIEVLSSCHSKPLASTHSLSVRRQVVVLTSTQ